MLHLKVVLGGTTSEVEAFICKNTALKYYLFCQVFWRPLTCIPPSPYPSSCSDHGSWIEAGSWGCHCQDCPGSWMSPDFQLSANAGEAAPGAPQIFWGWTVGAGCWMGEHSKGLGRGTQNSREELMEIWGRHPHNLLLFPIIISQKPLSSIPAPISMSSFAIVLLTQWPVIPIVVIQLEWYTRTVGRLPHRGPWPRRNAVWDGCPGWGGADRESNPCLFFPRLH